MSANPTYDEKELLLHIAAGDEKAFEHFYNTYQPLLATYIYRISKSRELAEEYTHDVFLKIWANREVLGEVKHIRAYIDVVSRNYVLNCIRSILKEQEKHALWLKDNMTTEVAADPPEVQLVYSLLDAAIDSLPAQQKKVYILARHERLTYNQIATQLGLGTGTVKRHLHLATQAITRYILATSSPGKLQLLLLILAAEAFTDYLI